jgi:hypothetical protein
MLKAQTSASRSWLPACSHTRRSQLTTEAGLIAPPMLSSRQPWSCALARAAGTAGVSCRYARRSTRRVCRRTHMTPDVFTSPSAEAI